MSATTTQRGPWLLFAALAVGCCIAVPAAHAKGDGGVGGATATDDDDEDLDDNEVVNPGKRGKPPSHFALKPSVRLGFRHFFDTDKTFSLEAYVRDQQGILNNPLSLRSSQVSGGLVTAYKFGATTWMMTFQTGDVFSEFYEHTVRTNYNFHTTLQQSIDLGDTDWSIVPKAQVGYQWSSDITQQRWKFQITTPVSYAISDTVILLPLMPKLSYQPYTDRPDNRADWTMNMSAGIRWVFASPSYLQTSFGFENRWSNVRSAAFSRWVLTPKLNLRVTF